MFKFISVLLLLVVCFLIGTIVGIDQHEQVLLPDSSNLEEQLGVVEVPSENSQKVNQQVQTNEVVNQEAIAQELATNNDHLSQKTASFLEVIVKGFYDMIVQILYQISQLFF